MLLEHLAEPDVCHYSVERGFFQFAVVLAAHGGDVDMICMLLAAAALSLLQAHGADRQPLRHSQLAGRRLRRLSAIFNE
eukprot:s2654_g2.t2